MNFTVVGRAVTRAPYENTLDVRSSIISQGCNVVCRSTPTRLCTPPTLSRRKSGERRNNITMSLVPSQCSLVLFAPLTTCFSSTSFRERRAAPAESDHRPSLSFIQFRRWVSTMSELSALAYVNIRAYLRVFLENLSKVTWRNTRVPRNPSVCPPFSTTTYLSLSDVRQRLLYNPRIIQFPSRHARTCTNCE